MGRLPRTGAGRAEEKPDTLGTKEWVRPTGWETTVVAAVPTMELADESTFEVVDMVAPEKLRWCICTVGGGVSIMSDR